MPNEHPAVTTFRKYLQIPSVHPEINYDECVKFITNEAKKLNLPIKVIEIYSGKPIVIITWKGTNPELPSLLLNSHMDVVPVFREYWKYEPFDAIKDENGNIYARGAQDMKCVGIQYMETIRRYLKEGLRFKRTIHISFVPDEEIGGKEGMGAFVKTLEFQSMNVGFAMDEGTISDSDHFFVRNAERVIWQLHVTCCGNTGHGSLLHENTAAEKMQYIINKFLEYRENEKSRLYSNPDLMLGDVTTINMTMLQGGIQMNVVPPEITAGFDMRLALDVNHEKFLNMIDSWCSEAGNDVRYTFRRKSSPIAPTPMDESNPWWMVFKHEIEKMGLKWKKITSPGASDNRYIRELGIPAIGFSPINNTPVLLHDNNEFLNEKVFLRGIEIYYNLIKGLASM
ncbi:aminoacylase-1A-like [Planococcus citri]|uniref:aminoacylase-1A-like n=1 Tax=Planococcus citri TaxID=170843 RepID=UPI0031F93CCB